MNRFIPWIGIGTSKFYDWKARYGKVNEHNAWVPRDHWLTNDEKETITRFKGGVCGWYRNADQVR